MPATTTYGPTGNAEIDGLLSGVKWAVTNLTYSFPASLTEYEPGYGSGEPLNNFGELTNNQKSAVQSILASYAAVTNLQFTQTSGGTGDLRFAQSDDRNTAWAYYPSSSAAEGGDVWFNNSSGTYDNPVVGNYAWTTILHEIGHALGLKHAHEVDSPFPALPSAHDSMEYTVMAYRSYPGASTSGGYTNESWGFAQTLMMNDIRALQELYGADFRPTPATPPIAGIRTPAPFPLTA